jgi:hypothetical protein
VRWNVLTDESVNEQIRERISVMRRYAFAEQDGPMIEASRSQSIRPAKVSIPCGYPSTSAPARYKRILQNLIAHEQT